MRERDGRPTAVVVAIVAVTAETKVAYYRSDETNIRVWEAAQQPSYVGSISAR
jgi:hypothetical protein